MLTNFHRSKASSLPWFLNCSEKQHCILEGSGKGFFILYLQITLKFQYFGQQRAWISQADYGSATWGESGDEGDVMLNKSHNETNV